eukprot:GHVU01150483.1.p3 GENE.GHVU01150483.1~~GHVU01150483.1.p3  ORF type:complete len:288 (-),score=53.68 GHVU01150483.1:3256-4119(-)
MSSLPRARRQLYAQTPGLQLRPAAAKRSVLGAILQPRVHLILSDDDSTAGPDSSMHETAEGDGVPLEREDEGEEEGEKTGMGPLLRGYPCHESAPAVVIGSAVAVPPSCAATEGRGPCMELQRGGHTEGEERPQEKEEETRADELQRKVKVKAADMQGPQQLVQQQRVEQRQPKKKHEVRAKRAKTLLREMKKSQLGVRRSLRDAATPTTYPPPSRASLTSVHCSFSTLVRCDKFYLYSKGYTAQLTASLREGYDAAFKGLREMKDEFAELRAALEEAKAVLACGAC